MFFRFWSVPHLLLLLPLLCHTFFKYLIVCEILIFLVSMHKRICFISQQSHISPFYYSNYFTLTIYASIENIDRIKFTFTTNSYSHLSFFFFFLFSELEKETGNQFFVLMNLTKELK